MNTRETIVQLLQKNGPLMSSVICRELGISRQAVNQHMQHLVRDKRVVKIGHTKGAYYDLPANVDHSQERATSITLNLESAEEDQVFHAVRNRIRLDGVLQQNVDEIIAYTFQEMMNNAIEHSGSTRAGISFEVSNLDVSFSIRDWGIGLFESVAGRFKRGKEADAISDLVKGKVTTMPDRHSGEGIFFTSRIADVFTIDSHRLQLVFDNRNKDVFSGERRHMIGTKVSFTLSRASRKKLRDVFARFAPERLNYQFDKTNVAVKLVKESYISRSEARRLLAGLDKFKEVELDFKGVTSMGQGFADEVFRVFPLHHDIEIRPLNANQGVAAMIEHVAKNR